MRLRFMLGLMIPLYLISCANYTGREVVQVNASGRPGAASAYLSISDRSEIQQRLVKSPTIEDALKLYFHYRIAGGIRDEETNMLPVDEFEARQYLNAYYYARMAITLGLRDSVLEESMEQYFNGIDIPRGCLRVR